MSGQDSPPGMTGMPAGIGPDIVDAIAEATAVKIAQALLRLPDDLRAELDQLEYQEFRSTPQGLFPGPNAYTIETVTRRGGIEMIIHRPDWSICWRGVIVLCPAAIPTGTGPTPGRST